MAGFEEMSSGGDEEKKKVTAEPTPQTPEVQSPEEVSFEDFLSELDEEVGEISREPATETNVQETPVQETDFGAVVANMEAGDEIQQMIEVERRREKRELRERGKEQLQSFYERFTQIEDDEKMVEGKLYYEALKGKKDAYLEAEAARFELRIARITTQIEMEHAFALVTGESVQGGDPEEAVKRLQRNLSELMKQKEEAFSDEEKANSKHYQQGVVDSLRGQGIHIVPSKSLHDRPSIESPEAYIDQLRAVREYRHSAEYHSGPDGISEERLEWAGISDDRNLAYDRSAQGMALAALEAGDGVFAGKALKFAEQVRKMSPDVAEEIKKKIAALDPLKKKEFIRAFQQA